MQTNSMKATFDQGPYKLSPAFSKLSVKYDDWMSFTSDERRPCVYRCSNFVPKTSPMNELSIEANHAATNASASIDTFASQESSDVAQEVPISPVARKIPLTAAELQIPNVSSTVLEKVFSDAQALLNDGKSMTTVPSKDLNMRAVINESDPEPFIVKPQKKNKNIFVCTCKVYSSLGIICQHSLTVSQVTGKLLEYVLEVKKCLSSKSRKSSFPNVTAGVQNTLPTSLRGMKKNEIGKAIQRPRRNEKRRQEKLASTETTSTAATEGVNTPIVSTNVNGSQVETQQFHWQQQQLHSENQHNQVQNFASPLQQNNTAASHDLLFTVPTLQRQHSNQNVTQSQQRGADIGGFFPVPRQPFPTPFPSFGSLDTPAYPNSLPAGNQYSTYWHSGLSPHPYEVVLLPANVTKCYGCGNEFTEKYKAPPHNVVIRHRDRRIRGRGPAGPLLYKSCNHDSLALLEMNPYL